MNPSSGGLLHRQRRIADPDQLRDAIYGTTMRIDRLSPTRAPSRLEQFHSMTGWGLDAAELHCRLYAEGPVTPGCVAVVFIFRANGSSLCGIKTEDRTVVVIPPGTTLVDRGGAAGCDGESAQGHEQRCQVRLRRGSFPGVSRPAADDAVRAARDPKLTSRVQPTLRLAGAQSLSHRRNGEALAPPSEHCVPCMASG